LGFAPAPERKDSTLFSAPWQKMAVLSVFAGCVGLLCSLLCSGPVSPPPADLNGMGGPDEPWPESMLAGEATAEAGTPENVAGDTDDLTAPETEDLLVIGRSQTFYEALLGHGAPHEDIMDLVAACKPFRNLRNVKRGDEFRLQQAPDGRIRSLSFDLDLESYLTFVREGDGYRVLERTYPVERRVCAVSGTINKSLYASLKSAGAPLSLSSKLNDILGWEIDFTRDLREGDTFRILYEEIYKDSDFVRTGSILATECVTRSRSHRAYRFADAEGHPGYYDPEGGNLQKQLMRAPLVYSRISSPFSWRRLHPILKRYMPHLGVDYAAPVGTPVWAAGDGIVVEASRNKANGRFLRIQHTNSSYESYYLHLARYAKGIQKGARVRQGQVIGYVGASGYATGPHLDFRVRKDGRFVNPRTLVLPPAAPVAESLRPAFEILAQLYDQTLADLDLESAPHQVALVQSRRPPLWDPPAAASFLAPPATEPVSASAP
jgi:murein DD-endopeptidase MepM/ murein hydrolase activator NlpD